MVMEQLNSNLIKQIKFVMEQRGWRNGKLIRFVIDSLERLEQGQQNLNEELIDETVVLKLKRHKIQ